MLLGLPALCCSTLCSPGVAAVRVYPCTNPCGFALCLALPCSGGTSAAAACSRAHAMGLAQQRLFFATPRRLPFFPILHPVPGVQHALSCAINVH